MTEEWEQDALKELFNMSLGRSVATLSEMVDDEIAVSVPQMVETDRATLVQRLNHGVRCGDGIVGMPFRMEFDHTPMACLALMSVPQQDSGSFMEALFGNPIPPEALSDLQQGAMQEMGNLFLYTCASSFSHFLELDIEGEKACFSRTSAATLVNLLPCGEGEALGGKREESDRFMELTVEFHAQSKNIHGRLSLLLEMHNDLPLHQALMQYMEKHLG